LESHRDDKDPYLYYLTVLFVLAGLLLRLVRLGYSPDYHYDEPLYMALSANLARSGVLSASGSWSMPFFYHPALFFTIQTLWFLATGITLYASRLLSVFWSVCTILLVWKMAGSVFRLKQFDTMILVGLLSFDNWSIFSSRLGLIESQLIFLSAAAIYLFWTELDGKERPFSGVFLGLSLITKFLGVIPLIVVSFYMLLKRRNKLLYLFLNLWVCFGIFALHSMVEAYFNPSEFFAQNFAQVWRLYNVDSSRGMYDLATAISGAWINLAFYGATYAVSMLGLTCLAYSVFKRRVVDYLAIWGGVVTVSMIVFRLKYPHYLTVAIIPLFLFAVSEVKLTRKWKSVMFILLVAVNLYGWSNRFILQYDGALTDSSKYLNSLPDNVILLCEEPVGMTSGKIWHRMSVHRTLSGFLWLNVTHVVFQQSFLQPPPPLEPDLMNYIQANCSLIRSYRGIWYEITIYERKV